MLRHRTPERGSEAVFRRITSLRLTTEVRIRLFIRFKHLRESSGALFPVINQTFVRPCGRLARQAGAKRVVREGLTILRRKHFIVTEAFIQDCLEIKAGQKRSNIFFILSAGFRGLRINGIIKRSNLLFDRFKNIIDRCAVCEILTIEQRATLRAAGTFDCIDCTPAYRTSAYGIHLCILKTYGFMPAPLKKSLRRLARSCAIEATYYDEEFKNCQS